MSNTTPSHGGHAKKASSFWISLQIRSFFLVLGIFFLIGLAFWARPKTSLVEKRDLAVFPRMTAATLWDGSFFSGVTTWYADTYPAREGMISAEASLENLYGLRTETVIVNANSSADEIPDLETVEVAKADFAALRASAEMEKSVAEDELDENAPDGSIHEQPEAVGTVYIAGGSGFSVYYFNQESVDAYVSMLNTVQDILGDGIDVYAIPTPDSFGIMLDRSVQESLTQYEGDAFDYFFKRLSPTVKGVNIFNILTNHNAEYIFFRTDHHWTALGAYYAYRQFCSVKGFDPHELSDFEEYVSGDFLGTFYSYSNHSPALAANPDHIHAYYPLSTNTMWMQTHDGQFLDFPIIREGNTYDLFIGSDEPFEEIDNPLINDGSACVLIKDSMGNAFAPFLVDHYDKVFVIDYRYYDGSLSQLIREEGIDDVLFMNNIEFMSSGLANSCYDLFHFDEIPAENAVSADEIGADAPETPEESAGTPSAQAPEGGAEITDNTGDDAEAVHDSAREAPAADNSQDEDDTNNVPAALNGIPLLPVERPAAAAEADTPPAETTPATQTPTAGDPDDLLAVILGTMLADLAD